MNMVVWQIRFRIPRYSFPCTVLTEGCQVERFIEAFMVRCKPGLKCFMSLFILTSDVSKHIHSEK